MQSGFAIIAASACLLMFGAVDVAAKTRVDPDFVLLGCLNDNGVNKDIEFARKRGPRKTWENIQYEDYRLSSVMRMSPQQKIDVGTCFTETMAKYR